MAKEPVTSGEEREKGLGRLFIRDKRDANYPLRQLLQARTDVSRFWRARPPLDQGKFPHCVGYAWKQWMQSAPLMINRNPDAPTIYREAQKVDEWEGENYDGTSVRAGAKVLQSLGIIENYFWAFDEATVREFVLSRGPVILGTNWYSGMDKPDSTYYINVSGQIEGGHAYCLIGYSHKRDAYRILNSWGRKWGENGRAWIERNDIQRLITEDGEACAAIEKR